MLIDLLTDSGTGAMSRDQWAAHPARRRVATRARRPGIASATPSRELFAFRHVIPTHQGRAAETILFSVIGGPGKVVPNNTHFDTTRANVEFTGAEARRPRDRRGTRPGEHGIPFKGNIDVAALDDADRGPRAERRARS